MIDENIAAALNTILPGKVFPLVAPRGTQAPYLIYQVVSAQTGDTLDCYAETRNDIQIDCYSLQLLEAKQVIQSVKSVLSVFKPGQLVELNDYEFDTRLYRATLELLIIT